MRSSKLKIQDKDREWVNVEELAKTILSAILSGLVNPQQVICGEVFSKNPLWLSSRQATSLALIINELIQNAVTHAFPHQREGDVKITLEQKEKEVWLEVKDNGVGIPSSFQIGKDGNLGWRIIYTLVQEELGGKVWITSSVGTEVSITFPKGENDGT